MFDKQWEKGEGFWVRKTRPPGRGTEWLKSKATTTSVHEAKRWPEGRAAIRRAVRGRWLEWVAGGTSHEGGEARAEMDSANQPEVESERQEGGAAERRRGQERGAQEQCSLDMEESIVRTHLDTCMSPAQYLGSGTRSEHEEQGDERPPARAATKARETARRRGQGLTDRRGKDGGGKGTKGRHTRPDQPQGAVSAPPHSPQPHQAQPHGERRPTRSRTGAPAKPREGIG